MTEAIQREQDFPHLNTDGICYLESVSRDVAPPALAVVRTSLGETLLVMTREIREAVERADRYGYAVRLRLSRTADDRRVIDRVWFLPSGPMPTILCPECGRVVAREDDYYRCLDCHTVTRVWPLEMRSVVLRFPSGRYAERTPVDGSWTWHAPDTRFATPLSEADAITLQARIMVETGWATELVPDRRHPQAVDIVGTLCVPVK